MDATRRKADHQITRDDRAAGDDQGLLDRTDRKTREIVFAIGIHVGHLGGFAADQRAAGLFAACRNSADHACSGIDIEPSAGEIVEKKQRLGALHQDVVDAHRHQIDAYRVMAPERKGHPQLGADPVGARHQHRLAVAFGHLEERAKAADAGEHTLAKRAARHRLDALDQGIAGIDVDTGILVGKGRGGVCRSAVGLIAHAGCGPSVRTDTMGQLAL